MAENLSLVAPAETAWRSDQLAALGTLARQMAAPQPAGGSVAPEQQSAEQIIAALAAAAQELATRRAMAHETEQRLGDVMNMMIAMAALDFSNRLPIGDDASILNAVATATNLLNDELRASVVSKAYVDNIVESISEPLLVVGLDRTIGTLNRAALDLAGYARHELIGRRIETLFADDGFVARAIEPVLARDVIRNVDLGYHTKNGRTIPVSFSASLMRDAAGEAQAIVCIAHDTTERRQAEEMLRQSLVQEEIIRTQSALLAELSTPLIPISDRVMVMPLIGTIDSRRVQHVLESLLSGIANSGAEVAILDITGVAMVDTQVANGLIRAAQAVKLLGARVMLTGIRPEVAQTLVGLGVDLSGIATHSSLQSGIAAAIGRR